MKQYSQIIITLLLVAAVMFAGVFAVTTSTLLQSIPCALIGLACLITLLFERNAVRIDKSFILWLLTTIYFITRAWLSPAKDFAVSDLILILSVSGVFYLNAYVLVNKASQYLLLGSVILLGVFNALNFVPAIGSLRDNLIPFAIGDHQSGMYNHRNFCGNMMMMVSLFLASLILWGNMKKMYRVLLILTFLGVCAALVLCGARGAYLGLIGGMVIILIFKVLANGSSSSMKIRSSGLLLLSILSVSLLLFGGIKLLNSRGTDVSDSLQFASRTKYFGMAIDQIPDAPFFGSGSMSYSYKCYENWSGASSWNDDHVWVHNEFLQTITDYGIVGLMLLILCLMSAIYIFIQHYFTLSSSYKQMSKVRIIYGVGGLAVVIGFCINSMVSFPAHSLPNIMIFALALSWLVKPREVENKKTGLYLHKFATLFLMGSIFVVSSNELKALKIFSKYGIFVDNARWVVSDHTNDDSWYNGLQEVVSAAPSSLRHERLSSLILQRAKREKDLLKKNKLLSDALNYCDLSLEFNPENYNSIRNKAKCLFLSENYSEANKWYEILTKKTKLRAKYYQPQILQARCLAIWAKSLSVKGEMAKATELFDAAYEVIVEAKASNKKVFIDNISFIERERIKHMMISNDVSLDASFNDFYNNRFKKYEGILAKSNQLIQHANLIKLYADKKFYKRKPKIAYKWYKLSLQCYKKIPKELSSEFTAEQKELLVKRIEFFKEANIKPAK